MKKCDIGIIGALEEEVRELISRLENHSTDEVGSILFHTGVLEGKNVVIAKCGVGKVFAALTAEAMIISYAPELIINTGVGGALKKGISVTDTLIADKLVQHDMDTSPLGDPKGLISGINVVYFEANEKAVALARSAADKLGIVNHVGTVASGDIFVSTKEQKERIVSEFSASVCEMEGAAIAQVAYVNKTAFAIIRAVSDSADEGSSMDYMKFLPIAAKNGAAITVELCKAW